MLKDESDIAYFPPLSLKLIGLCLEVCVPVMYLWHSPGIFSSCSFIKLQVCYVTQVFLVNHFKAMGQAY